MSLVERSIRQPVAVTVAILLIILFGVAGLQGWFPFLKLPVQLTPNVDQPVITVTTNWFGAAPEEVEQEILKEQEDVLKLVSGLREMTSTAQEGQGTVELTFYVGVNKDAALNEVRDRLRTVPDYPADVDQPIVESVDSGADSPIAWMIVRPVPGQDPTTRPALAGIPGYSGDVTQLQDFLEDEVKPLLERVPGVAGVQVLGGREREMQVRVDLEKLASRGIGIAQFVESLRQENLNVSAGAVSSGKQEVTIRAMGQYEDDPQPILDTIVAYTSAGAPVYVRDVADVAMGFKRQVALVRSAGQSVIAMNARRETGSNVLTVMAGLKQAIIRANTDVLAGRNLALEIYQVYDESLYVTRSLENARGDLILGGILAAGVLLVTLRSIGATLVITLSIPIAVLGTFVGMALAGRNLNVISLAGMTFSIGFGIDNTIVVLENIFRHRELGKDRIRAAIDGTREVWGAIVAASLTNVVVFVPILFIEEEAGQLFRDISVAITISMFFYLFISPSVIPMLAALFLRRMPGGFVVEGAHERSKTRIGRLTAPIGQLGERMSGLFYRIILWLTGGFLRRAVMVITFVGVSGALAWLLIPPRTYLPPGNQNFVFSVLAPPPGYSIEEFRAMGEMVEGRLRQWWQVKQGSPEHQALQQQWLAANKARAKAMRDQLDGMKQAVAAGKMPADQLASVQAYLDMQISSLETSPPPPAIADFFFVSFSGRAFMGASSQNPDVVDPLVTLMNQALEGIPGTMGRAFQMPIFNTGNDAGAGLEVVVSGTNYDQVRPVAGMIQGMMMQQFKTFVLPNPLNFSLGRPEVQVVPNRIAGASAGISSADVRQAAQVAIDGAIIGDYRTQGQAIDLVVMAQHGQDESGRIRALETAPLAMRDGRVVPLASVANFVKTSAPQQILRFNRMPAVTLSVALQPGQTINEAQQIMQEQVLAPLRASGAIPPGVTISQSGSANKLDEFMEVFKPGFALAAVMTYLLMAALFESWLHPLVIIMSVPLALVGGIWGLALLHAFVPTILLDVLTMLGFVILIGVIVNNPILIVHQALNYVAQGMDRQHAIAKSTQTRVRPIFMSVITTVAGMAPLVVFGGAGSELYRGLGAVVIGGLLLSTVFTLFLTPTLMSLAMDLQELTRRIIGPKDPKSPHKTQDNREPVTLEA